MNEPTRTRMSTSPVIWPAILGGIAGAAAFTAAVPFQSYWIGRVIVSWPNLLSMIAFGIAMALLFTRAWTISRELKGFNIDLLGDDPDTLLLPEDALNIRKRLRELENRERELTLLRLLDAGLQRARANWSAEDVGTAIKTEAELVAGSNEAQYSLVRYLAWAIPSLGFIGTVLGVGDAMGAFGVKGESVDIALAARSLNFAFDTTFVALVLSLVLMYMIHRVQGRDDAFLVDATSWCMRRFVYRMHIIAEPSV